MSKHTPGPWHLIQVDDKAARLIEAAPELLQALHAILLQVCQGSVLERDACISQARAAIAKAEGAA